MVVVLVDCVVDVELETVWVVEVELDVVELEVEVDTVWLVLVD